MRYTLRDCISGMVDLLLQQHQFVLHHSSLIRSLVNVYRYCINLRIILLMFRIPWLQYPIIYDIRSRPRSISSPTGSKGKIHHFPDEMK